MTNEDGIKLVKISSDIIEILDDKEEMSNGDFQGCVEAQVMNAYFLGQKSK